MADVFRIKAADAVALCVAVGFKNADKYKADRLQQRVASLDEAITPEVMEGIEDKKVAKRAKSLLAALQAGTPVEVVQDEAAAESAPPEAPAAEEKPAKKGKKPKKEEVAEEPAAEEKPAKKKGGKEKTPAPKEKSGDGVIATIAACLMKASEKKPTTKQEILAALVKKFPDRRAESMKSTINHQVPSYLTKAGYKIKKSDKGYWIPA